MCKNKTEYRYIQMFKTEIVITRRNKKKKMEENKLLMFCFPGDI